MRNTYYYNRNNKNNCSQYTCKECVTGACCLPDGTCSDDFSQNGCDYYNGTFYPNKKCSDPEVVCVTPTPTPTVLAFDYP